MSTLSQNQKKVLKLAAKSTLVKGKVSNVRVRNILKIIQKKPTGNAILALRFFQKNIQHLLSLQTIYISSAKPLPARLKTKLRLVLQREYKSMDQQYLLDPSLVGGLKIKVRDDEFNSSIQSKLSQVTQIYG